MTLNVENLFDLNDDEDKNDETFLPAAMKNNGPMRNRCRASASTTRYAEECLQMDWSKRILERKMARLTTILEQVNQGNGPDVLILQEVENLNVLRMWRDGYLKKMNYQTMVLIEGPDERGIDNAVLSRLPQVGEAKLHLMDYSTTPELQTAPQRPTRGILEVTLKTPSHDNLAVFALHFPSQGAPTVHRKAAVDTLLKLTSQVPVGTPVVVGGDFNITSTEDLKQKYFTKTIQPKMSVSHIVGCGECTGTTYWWKDATWSFFDVLLFSKDLDGGTARWQLDRDSIRIVSSSKYQWNQYGSPAKFKEGLSSTGVTDHFPMYAELKMKKAQEVAQ
jgi:endonuclease/exonuclease/phosphatase family metal-dependent hydrolase